MPGRESFTVRYETRRPGGGLVYDDVPERVRAGLLNVVETLLGHGNSEWVHESGASVRDFVKSVYQALDRRVDGTYYWAHMVELVGRVAWDDFCDVCEAVWSGFASGPGDRYSNELNALFARNYFGYELRDGRMERVGARVHEESVAKARGILRDPDLAGPDEQFQKAIGFYNRRPDPDCENSVKEAVSAVEGVARVLTGNLKLTLSKVLAELKREQGVHPTLIQLLEKLYAYRGDAGGVGHGLTGKQEVRQEEAEFVLGVSASAIVYLARLHGREVE